MSDQAKPTFAEVVSTEEIVTLKKDGKELGRFRKLTATEAAKTPDVVQATKTLYKKGDNGQQVPKRVDYNFYAPLSA